MKQLLIISIVATPIITAFFGYLDELWTLAIAIAWSAAFLKRRSERDLGDWLFLAYGFVACLNFIVSKYSNSGVYAAAQILISGKMFFVLWLSEKVSFHRPAAARMWIFLLGGFAALGLAANLALGAKWNAMMGAGEKMRDGRLRPVGFYDSTGELSQVVLMVGILFVTAFFARYTVSKYSGLVKIVPSLALLTEISTVRKGYVMLIFYVGWVFLASRKGASKIAGVIGFGVILAVLAAAFVYLKSDSDTMNETMANIESFEKGDDTQYIRAVMVLKGLSVANDHFPFGSSPATFGTPMTERNTNKLYMDLGVSPVFYDAEEGASGVYDSIFFSLLAENGYIGMLLLILALLAKVRAVRGVVPRDGLVIYDVTTLYVGFNSLTGPSLLNGTVCALYFMAIMAAKSMKPPNEKMKNA
jgi:hypothetical protein